MWRSAGVTERSKRTCYAAPNTPKRHYLILFNIQSYSQSSSSGQSHGSLAQAYSSRFHCLLGALLQVQEPPGFMRKGPLTEPGCGQMNLACWSPSRDETRLKRKEKVHKTGNQKDRKHVKTHAGQEYAYQDIKLPKMWLCQPPILPTLWLFLHISYAVIAQ